MQMTQKISLALKLLVLAATAGLLGGCADYLARHEGITFGAGEAAARNAAIHTIDPWPRHAANTRIDADGKRMLVGMKEYQANEKDGKSKAPQTGAPQIPVGSSTGVSN